MPHVPLGVSEKFKGHSKQGMYGDVIEEIDWSVGQVLEALDRYKLSENTMVIFTSDNGPWLSFGNHAGSTGGLREGKGTAFEGGPRVPAIMRWPGRIDAGSVCEKMASTIDILPTLSAIASANLPKHPIDGVNILPLLEGDKEANPRKHFFYYYGAELRGVREGKWKRVFEHRTRSYEDQPPGMDGHPGKYSFPTVSAALYDLETDIAETTDLSSEYPEVVARLDVLAEEARSKLGDRLRHRQGSEVRPPGRKGFERETTVKNMAAGCGVTLTDEPSIKYPVAGAGTLINGHLGSRDFHDGQWLGFEGNNMEATIDLGAIKTVQSVTAHFLRNQISWIFLPKEVSVAISTDGRSWHAVGKKQMDLIQDMSTEVVAVEIPVTETVRYVKVKGINIGRCPDWHAGDGGKAWLFCDEVVVV